MVKTFVISGKPVGYYACGKFPNWTRMKEYHAWKEHAQACAVAAGMTLPLTATKDRPIIVSVRCYFENGVHCDTGNVQKGTCDALFYGGKGDKFSGGHFTPPFYDKQNPRVEVEVEFG